MFGRASVVIKLECIEIAHILEIFVGFSPSEFVPGDADFFGLAKYVVVNVSNILYVGHRMIEIAEISDEYVEGQKCKGVTDMCRVIWGDAAHVDSDIAIWGRKQFILAR